MKQLLLATALIALPVAGFTAFNVYRADASVSAVTPAGLGDLSVFATIVTDVQALAAQGDLVGAKNRIRDLEIAWDANEVGLKPLDTPRWHAIDGTTDAALHALRAATPDAATVTQTLAALATSLQTATH